MSQARLLMAESLVEWALRIAPKYHPDTRLMHEAWLVYLRPKALTPNSKPVANDPDDSDYSL